MFFVIMQWFAYFIVYCFAGWCIESTIVSFSQRKLINRGFLKGPFLPIYGFGALTMVASSMIVPQDFISGLERWQAVALLYFSGVVAATVLELIAGIMIENIFKMKYWDYTGKFCNFKGYICLKSSLFWGVLTLLVVYGIHPLVSEFVQNVPENVLAIVLGASYMAIGVDLVKSFRDAFDVQKFLAYQAKVEVELNEIKSKLALAKETVEHKADEIGDYVKQLESKKEALLEEIGRKKASAKAGFARLRNYPSAHSKKFAKSFGYWKEYFIKH